MTTYVALLRAVNVGGTGKLAMADLRSICERSRFAAVETYIASGNVVFTSPHGPSVVKRTLEAALEAHLGKAIGVAVRTADDLRDIVRRNPFVNVPANLTAVVFLDEPPPPDALELARGGLDEEMRLGPREIYVHYPRGIGRSKLKIPAARLGTARNAGTVAALSEIAARK